jgi:hypothetical protein
VVLVGVPNRWCCFLSNHHQTVEMNTKKKFSSPRGSIQSKSHLTSTSRAPFSTIFSSLSDKKSLMTPAQLRKEERKIKEGELHSLAKEFVDFQKEKEIKWITSIGDDQITEQDQQGTNKYIIH